MSKKFKLVYESEGILKGSYSGIPSKEDAALIERAVLEGSKQVSPTPEPDPTPEPTPSDKPIEVSIDEFKAILEDFVWDQVNDGGFGDYASHFKYNTDYICRAMGVDFADLWCSLDTELIKVLVESCSTPWMSVCGWNIEQLSENDMGVFSIIGEDYWNGGYQYGSIFGVEVATDAETGDSRIVCHGWPETNIVELKFNIHK